MTNVAHGQEQKALASVRLHTLPAGTPHTSPSPSLVTAKEEEEKKEEQLLFGSRAGRVDLRIAWHAAAAGRCCCALCADLAVGGLVTPPSSSASVYELPATALSRLRRPVVAAGGLYNPTEVRVPL